MSWIDSRWELWDSQDLTVTEESRTNGNSLDLEENGATDESIGDKLWFNLIVETAFTTLTEGAYFTVINSDSATFATGSGGEQSLGGFGSEDYPLLIANLAAGKRFSIAFPRYNLMRYLEAVFVAVNTAAGAGRVSAWFGLEPLSELKVQKNPT